MARRFFAFATGYRLGTQVLALVVTVISLVMLLVWEQHTFLSSLPGLSRPLTSVTFIFCAAALWIQSGDPARARGSLLVLCGCILLVALLSLTNLFDPGGGMSPVSAGNFILMAFALGLLDFRTRGGAWPAQWLVATVMVISIISMASYLYQPQMLYQHMPYVPMSLPSAILFFLLGSGIFLSRPDRGLAEVVLSPRPGGWLARRLLPITTFFPFCLGWLRTFGERVGLYEREFGLAFFSTANICIMGTLVWFSARALNRSDESRRRGEDKLRDVLLEVEKANRRLSEEIARRREAESTLRQLNDNLEAKVIERTARFQQANRELEAFSYSVSHDLRAPLRAMNGYSRLLVDSSLPRLTEVESSYLERICANGERMNGLIDALLKLSRLARSELKLGPVDLTRLATEILNELISQVPERKVEIKIEWGLQVYGDESLLRVVLENLLGNAWKFTSKREKARIEFRKSLEGEETVFIVEDNGAGFDMGYASKLFGAFQRFHSPQEFEGTGVGLATVRRILERHRGRVWGKGIRDQGARFCFTLGDVQQGD